VPVVIILFTVRSDVPVFLIVTILEADIAPTSTEPKLTDLGETAIFGGGACPESLTLTTGFLGSLEVILINAFFFPQGSVGMNVTETLQEPFVFMVVQSLV
jgi:hypothetical protein